MGDIIEDVTINDNFWYIVTADHFAEFEQVDGCGGIWNDRPSACRKGDVINNWINNHLGCTVGNQLVRHGGIWDQERITNILGPFSDDACLIPV